MNDVATRFGENLAQARRKADLTQEQLGLRASINRTQIGILERGARLPRIDTFMRLAGALGVSPDRLLEGISWRPGYRTEGRFESPSPGDD